MSDTAPQLVPAASPQRWNRAAFGLRFLAGICLLIYGVGGLFVLQSKWALYSAESIVEPFWEPVSFLLSELCIVLTGVFLLLGRRWVFIFVGAHLLVAVWKCVRAEQIQLALFALAMALVVDLLLFGFCFWQWRTGRLQ